MPIDYAKVENVSLTQNEEDFLMQNLENMLLVVGEDFRLTPHERKSINGINYANKGFVQDALGAIRLYEEMLPGYIEKSSIETAWRYYIQLEKVKLLLDRLSDVIRDRKQAVGALLFRDSRTVYRILKAADTHAIGGLEPLIKRMKKRFLGQGIARKIANTEAVEMPLLPDTPGQEESPEDPHSLDQAA